MRFLDVTLDTCQDTSGYMYLGRFITIHQDTPRYKITIQVSWTGYMRDRIQSEMIPRMYPERHVSEMQDTYLDTFGIHVSAEVIQIHTGYI